MYYPLESEIVVTDAVLNPINLPSITNTIATYNETSNTTSYETSITYPSCSEKLWQYADIKAYVTFGGDNLESIYNNDVTCYTSFQVEDSEDSVAEAVSLSKTRITVNEAYASTIEKVPEIVEVYDELTNTTSNETITAYPEVGDVIVSFASPAISSILNATAIVTVSAVDDYVNVTQLLGAVVTGTELLSTPAGVAIGADSEVAVSVELKHDFKNELDQGQIWVWAHFTDGSTRYIRKSDGLDILSLNSTNDLSVAENVNVHLTFN